ncbi:DNA adenine methylase [Stenotrophomonas sp. C1657]|uniref:DNA adenine methylase n=1 Tax=Stenotrophomonas sp. C1657 TaxID=3077844 RepID=UPI0035A0A973
MILTEAVKPVLRWAGSKQRLIPALVRAAPKAFNRYFEPFSGSAALFFAMRPRLATLSDSNRDLINFYIQMRRAPMDMFEVTSSLGQNLDEYLSVRQRFNQESDNFTRACLFYYLNRTCFNGLFRTNKQGGFNVPMGSKLPNWPSVAQFMTCAHALEGVDLIFSDYESVIDRAKHRDFLYVDPPYARGSTRDRGEYGAGAMGDADLPRLIASLRRADSRGVLILLSYNSSLRDSFPDWNHAENGGRYLISADPGRRVRMKEYSSSNY